MCFFKATLRGRQRSSHSVLLTTPCEPFNQYRSPLPLVSARFPILRYNSCLGLCSCRYLRVTFEIVSRAWSHHDWFTAVCPCHIRKGCRDRWKRGEALMRETERERERERSRQKRDIQTQRETVCVCKREVQGMNQIEPCIIFIYGGDLQWIGREWSLMIWRWVWLGCQI